MGFQADCRAAAVAFLTDYAAAVGIGMQVYPARPRSIHPPTGFVDGISEVLDHTTLLTQRIPSVELVVIHGIFDSKEAANQKDGFVDGLIDWAETRYHQAGANTMVAIDATEDVQDYVPPWMPPAEQLVYYATRISLGGFRRG